MEFIDHLVSVQLIVYLHREGLRLYNGKWFCLEPHLKRLYEAVKFLDFDVGMSPKELAKDLYKLVELNSMER